MLSLNAATAQAPLSLTTNSFADSIDLLTGDGLCADDVGLCTLRAAVMEGNASATGAVIELPAGDYVRTIDGVGGAEVGGLNITGDITIMGGGQHATIIDAASMDRVFVVTAGASLTLSDLTIQHGLALVAGTGGGVLAISGPTTLNMSNVSVRDNDSGAIGGGITIGFGVTAVLEGVEIVGNHAPSIGGGILTVGSLTMRDSVIANNTADNGGGLWARFPGIVVLERVEIANNSDGQTGGGVWNSSDMTLTDVSVSDNIAARSGDGIQNVGGAVTLTDVDLFNNTATAGRGGGISTESRALGGERFVASVNIIGGSLVSNTAGHSGGAIFNFGGALFLTDVDLWDNDALGDSGGAIDN